MNKIQKIKNEIKIVLETKKCAKNDVFLDRSTAAMCRKLEIGCLTITGGWNGWGYERLGIAINDNNKAITITNSALLRLRRQLKKEEKKPVRKIRDIGTITDALILNNEQDAVALAIYNLSKIAKKYRDRAKELRSRIYDDDYEEDYEKRRQGTSAQHEAMHEAHERKEYLYNKKDEYLSLAITRYEIQCSGYHEFADRNRDFYELGKFSFHLNNWNSDKNLGSIEEEITSEKTGRKLSEEAAFLILSKVFLKELIPANLRNN